MLAGAELAAACALLPALAGDFSLPSPAEVLRSASQTAVPALSGAPVPFLRVELRMAPFRGRTSLETRAKAERFAAGLGLPLAEYQDNEVYRFLDAVPERTGDTLMGRAQRALFLREARRALEADPRVKEVTENGAGFLTALFARPLYEEEVAAVKARLPAGVTGSTRRNTAMKGLWLRLAVPPGQNPETAAAALAAAHPSEVAEARAMVEVPVFKLRTGTNPGP